MLLKKGLLKSSIRRGKLKIEDFKEQYAFKIFDLGGLTEGKMAC